jgi:hypothetical protein
MALVDRLFGRPPRVPELKLSELLAWLTSAVARLPDRPADLELVRARLADRCRDVGLGPLLPEDFDAMVADLDAAAQLRLALLVGMLDLDPIRACLPDLVVARPLTEVVAASFVGLARQTPLLTLELLRQSPLRREELARRFTAALGASVHGESAKASAAQLQRLDYERLLAEAQRAQESATERLERLKKLQDEQEANRPRRGKW